LRKKGLRGPEFRRSVPAELEDPDIIQDACAARNSTRAMKSRAKTRPSGEYGTFRQNASGFFAQIRAVFYPAKLTSHKLNLFDSYFSQPAAYSQQVTVNFFEIPQFLLDFASGYQYTQYQFGLVLRD
jgi:hypothetical protein